MDGSTERARGDGAALRTGPAEPPEDGAGWTVAPSPLGCFRIVGAALGVEVLTSELTTLAATVLLERIRVDGVIVLEDPPECVRSSDVELTVERRGFGSRGCSPRGGGVDNPEDADCLFSGRTCGRASLA